MKNKRAIEQAELSRVDATPPQGGDAHVSDHLARRPGGVLDRMREWAADNLDYGCRRIEVMQASYGDPARVWFVQEVCYWLPGGHKLNGEVLHAIDYREPLGPQLERVKEDMAVIRYGSTTHKPVKIL